MKKFYNEPEMSVKRFEADDIVTTSQTLAGNETVEDLEGYATKSGTLSKDGAGVVLSFH